MKSRGVAAYEDQQDSHAREVHRLKCRVIELEAFARRVAEGEHVDELPEEARALLTKGVTR